MSKEVCVLQLRSEPVAGCTLFLNIWAKKAERTLACPNGVYYSVIKEGAIHGYSDCTSLDEAIYYATVVIQAYEEGQCKWKA